MHLVDHQSVIIHFYYHQRKGSFKFDPKIKTRTAAAAAVTHVLTSPSSESIRANNCSYSPGPMSKVGNRVTRLGMGCHGLFRL